MSTNAASIAVLNVTLGYRDLFVTLSTTLHTYSSPRDLNLGYWEAIPWTKIYRRCLRANFESNDSYKPVHRPAEKHMAFRTPQFQQSMLIFATIALGHPKSALEPFQRLRESSRTFFRVILPRWHTGIFVGLF